nr:DinB family protein [Chryseobacterium sp. CBo1]
MVDYNKTIENYDEQKYSQMVSIKFSEQEWKMEFVQTVLHHNNHATYHRGQLVTMLRQAGFVNLSNTDLATYLVKIK